MNKQIPNKINELLQSALADHHNGRYESARQKYIAVLEIQPTHPDALNLLSALFLINGYAKEAADFAQDALNSEPGFLAARVNLANAQQGLGLLSSAIEHYEFVISKGEAAADVYLNLGNTLLSAKQPEKAEFQFLKAMEGKGNKVKIFVGLAHSFMDRGLFEEAEAYFQQALRENTSSITIYLSYGKMLKEIDRIEDAIDQYRQAWELDHQNPRAYEMLAYSLIESFESHKNKRAGQELEGLLKLDPPQSQNSKLVQSLIGDCLKSGASNIKKINLLENSDQDVATTVKGTKVFNLGKATVCNRVWYIIKDNQLYPDVHAHLPENLSYPPPTFWPTKRATVDQTLPHAKIEGRVFLLGGCTNYYHWLVDHLPAIEALQQLDNFETISILTNNDLTTFQKDSLVSAGINLDQLVSFDEAAYIDCEQLVVPVSIGKRSGEWGKNDWWWQPTLMPQTREWLRKTFLSNDQLPAKRKIFISRRNASNRKAINELELHEIAKELGYIIIAPETLSLRAQIKMFSQASHIAGVHGAGFTNAIFSPKGAKVIEFIGEWAPPEFYAHTAKICGHEFRRVLCSVTDISVTEHSLDRRYNHIEVDLEKAKQALSG